MLRSFRVSNHRSIRDEQELLLMPAYDKDRAVVPVAGIFGANASGKSNLLHALQFMAAAARASYAVWEPGSGIPRHPFRLDSDTAGNPSLYAIELLVDGVRHTYGFTIDDERVLDEWLYSYPVSNRKRIIFERSGKKWTFGTAMPRARVEVLRELTRPNALFLSVAARAELIEVLPVYTWFQRRLLFPGVTATLTQTSVIEWVEQSRMNRAMLVELLRIADFGISDIRVVKPDQTPDYRVAKHVRIDANGRPLPRLAFLHGAQHTELSAQDQSQGTLAWLNLLVPALTALEEGSVLCVDEIDSSLHPRLTARLLELFQDERSNPSGAQFLFTTHDATLLGTSFGREILDRDQIWFVQKDSAGATSLFPLTDFHPRKDENTERRYLGGSYGAVPAVYSDTLVERLAELREGHHGAAS